MISIFENDIEAEPTADELSAAVQAALVQYRAAEAKDLDAYIKSFRFTELSEPIVSMLQDMYQHREGDELRVYLRQSGLSAKYELIDDMVSVTDELIEDRFKDEFESIEDSFRPENYDETRLFLRQALGCITANSQKVKDNIEYETFFDSESGVDPLSGITENTVYTFYVEHCSRDQPLYVLLADH